MVITPGPLAHVTGICSSSNWPVRAKAGAPWLRYVPSASWQAVHAFCRGTVRAALIIAGSNLASTAVKFPAARSATTWSAREANGPGDAGEIPATPLLQAVRKHTTASDPSAAAQRFTAHPVPPPGAGSARSRACRTEYRTQRAARSPSSQPAIARSAPPPGARRGHTPARARRSARLTPDPAGPV